MSLSDKILVQLYFPHFNSPSSSRFEALFLFLDKNNRNKNKNKNKNNNISYYIFPERIIRGEDKRTSILIKNIPKTIKKREIRSLVENFANINYLGIKQDKKSKDFNIAYLNVINYKSVVPIYMGLRKHTFDYHNTKIVTELFYSKYQGKEELKKLLNR